MLTCPNCQVGLVAGAKLFLTTVTSVNPIQMTSKVNVKTPHKQLAKMSASGVVWVIFNTAVVGIR